MVNDELLQSIRETDGFFCRIIDLIHPDHYGFDDEVKEELKNRKHELVDKKLTNFERKRLKEHGRQLLGRLDASRCRTVTEIWSWQSEQSSRKKGYHHQGRKKSDVFPTNPSLKNSNFENGDVGNTENRNELATKLQTKISTMREQRKASKNERKRKRKEENKIDKRQKLNKTENKRIKSEANDNDDIETSTKDSLDGKKNSRMNAQPVITNSEGQTVYSKFDFSVLGVKSKGDDKKKRKSKLKLTGKDYKKLLQTVEKRDEMIENLKRENPEKARSIENQQHWDAAMDRAQGMKVKDDKNLLKKNLKRKEKQKKKSEKQWASREEHVRQKMDKRQEDRKRNLQNRKDDKKKKKLEKARKKGRLV